MGEINAYMARGVIRYLDDDYKEFHRLRNKALEIHKEEQYQRRCILTIGEAIPENIKRKIYKMVN